MILHQPQRPEDLALALTGAVASVFQHRDGRSAGHR
jgi:hypothetical protein